MKTVFTIWDGRIAPVFDTAREACLIESSNGKILSEETLALPPHAVAWMLERQVDEVVCGAISRLFHERLRMAGIRVVPFVAGEIREVIQAWLDGTVNSEAFRMPGCCGRRRMRRHCCRGHF